MKILFLGQLGLATTSPATAQQRRLGALAQELARQGHQVTILGTPPYVRRETPNYFGATILTRPSLNPQKPGGWFYVLQGIITLWRQQPHVTHLHGWRAASLIWLMAVLSPETNFIWTIDSLPRRNFRTRLTAWQAQRLCNAITTPTRCLQYEVLQSFKLRTTFIPDGYQADVLRPLPLKPFRLRPSNYTLLLTTNPAVIRKAARAYRQAKSRKKLAFLSNTAKSLVRSRRATLLHPVGTPTGRKLRTLLANAAAIIVPDTTTSLETLLEAMDTSRPIIACNHPLYQETLGVTATFYNPKDPRGLATAIKSVFTSPQKSSALGRAAATRARRHFLWPHIIPEYITLYRYAEVKRVPVDSLQPVRFTQLSV